MKKIMLAICTVAGLMAASCGGEAKKQTKVVDPQLLKGKWMQGDSTFQAGFALLDGGVAAPINADAWALCAWKVSNDTLFLGTADSVFAPWVIKNVDQNELVITQDDVNMSSWERSN